MILVGQEEVIRQTLAKEGVTNLPDGLTIHNATQVIEICDNPSTAWRRKKDSSLTVGMNLISLILTLIIAIPIGILSYSYNSGNRTC